MAIVYLHKKKGTEDVFYVGIGALPERASCEHKRNQLWNKIVKKYGYYINITHENLCWEEACIIEKYLISFYGRIDIGTGILSNMTNGGDGTFGKVCTESTKEKISKKAKERLSIKENNPMYGKKQSIESIEKNRNSQLGEKSFMFGKKGNNHPMFGFKFTQIQKDKINRSGSLNPRAQKLLAIKDGNYLYFDTIKEAKSVLKISNTSITYGCKNESKTVKGYMFKYIN